MKQLIFPDKEKCVKCGICAEICPMSVIDIDDNGYPTPEKFAYKLCINCGYCVDVCVFGALHHRVRKHSFFSKAALKRYRILQENKNKE